MKSKCCFLKNQESTSRIYLGGKKKQKNNQKTVVHNVINSTQIQQVRLLILYT